MTRVMVLLSVGATLVTTGCGASPKEVAHAAVELAMERYAERETLWKTAADAVQEHADLDLDLDLDCNSFAFDGVGMPFEGRNWTQLNQRERELRSLSTDIRQELSGARSDCLSIQSATKMVIRRLRETAERAGEVPTTTFTRIREVINQTSDDTLERTIAEATNEERLFTVLAALATGGTPQAWANTISLEYQQEQIDGLRDSIEEGTALYDELLQTIRDLKERHRVEAMEAQ